MVCVGWMTQRLLDLCDNSAHDATSVNVAGTGANLSRSCVAPPGTSVAPAGARSMGL